MSIAIDSETEIDGEEYDLEFDEHHTVDDEMVTSTCTDTGDPCWTCD